MVVRHQETKPAKKVDSSISDGSSTQLNSVNHVRKFRAAANEDVAGMQAGREPPRMC